MTSAHIPRTAILPMATISYAARGVDALLASAAFTATDAAVHYTQHLNAYFALANLAKLKSARPSW